MISAVGSVIGAVLVPLLLYRFRQATEERQRQHEEGKEALRTRTEEISEGVHRIENHMLARINEVGKKLDEHIAWHIRRTSHDD